MVRLDNLTGYGDTLPLEMIPEMESKVRYHFSEIGLGIDLIKFEIFNSVLIEFSY